MLTRIIIFLLTSFFIDSIHSNSRNKKIGCEFSMKNGRENRTNGNEEEGEEEKETLSTVCKQQAGDATSVP